MHAQNNIAIEAARAGLICDAPGEEQRDQLRPFADLIGSWNLEITDIAAGGARKTFSGTWDFFWGLGGRAVLDVWRVPGREHGLTVRFFDPSIDALRSTWIAPQGGLVMPFIGRYDGSELTLEHTGAHAAATASRWIFSDIAPASFKWRGERLENGRWILEQTMSATRAAVNLNP